MLRWRVLGTVVAPLALVAACSSGSGSGGSGTTPVLPRVTLVSYDDCKQVLNDLRAATERQVGPYGLRGGPVPQGLRGDSKMSARAQGAAPSPAEAGGGAQQGEQYSGTNSHEAAADEPDLVKTDGRRIVTLARGKLQVIDPATRKVTHRLDIGKDEGDRPLLPDGSAGSQLLLSGDRALILTPHMQQYDSRLPGKQSDVAGPGSKPVQAFRQTILTLVDLAGEPKVIGSLETSADYVDARQTGSVARVVVRSSPQIDFLLPQTPRSERQALEQNRQIVRSAPLEAWQPAFEVRGRNGGKATTYKTPCANISHPRDDAGTSMLSVLTLDLAKDLGDPRPVSIAAEGQQVYGNGGNLYVTSTTYPVIERRTQRPDAQTTQIHKFRTGGAGRPSYVGSGSVPGSLLNQYSMSEHEGRLRIATTTTPLFGADPGGASPAQQSQTTVYVLAERDKRLTQVGKVGGLGKGERVYSVRFIGPTGYVVTFRQVDPLYVIDLRNPAKPRVTGELKITGYSAYLHPMPDGRLMGVGQEADTSGRRQGTQVSLFDVSAAPRRVGAYHLPGASSAAEFDPHAFLYWPRTGLTVLPVTRRVVSSSHGDGGHALVLKVNGSRVQRLGEIEHPATDDDYITQIQRSLIVGDTLWTISPSGARATGITTLDDRGWLTF